MKKAKTFSASGCVSITLASSTGVTSLAQPLAPLTALESRFDILWRCDYVAGPKLTRQHKFDDARRWRFDFVDLAAKVAIELEGGTWAGYQRGGNKRGGWHQNPKVYAANCEKYNEAAFQGWIVFRLTTEQVTPDNVKRIAEFCRDRADENERNGNPE